MNRWSKSAKREKIVRGGVYSLPEAVIATKQAAGRLNEVLVVGAFWSCRFQAGVQAIWQLVLGSHYLA